LWSTMMEPALEPDPVVVEAINRLRASNRFKVAALTNNFSPSPLPSCSPSSSRARDPTATPSYRPTSAAALRAALHATAREAGETKGAGNDVMRGLFDAYFESCVEGLRKPDPRFFRLALTRLGVKAEETVFLDDIGHNLAAARGVGMRTIRVHHGRSSEAIEELERLLEMDLGLRGSVSAKL
ncbi:hypothetical protein JCM10207_003004, partial [Rhodosporidiobolus poonsookiae]